MEKEGLKLASRASRASMHLMTITLNGTKREFPEPLTMADLLEAVGLAGKPVVVEKNQLALLPREIGETSVAEGDVIEIVQITAGG
jgi:thiamine biosynthesis protein ThiS